MKKLVVLCVFLFARTAFAEHDATYCGTLEKASSNSHIAILNVSYYSLKGDSWEDNYIEETSRATIYDVDSIEKLIWFLENSKPTTVFCLKGRWGGAYFSHNLISDNIQRIDYASKF